METVIHGRWIIPVEPAGQVLDAHSIVLRDGRIAAILPTAQARARYSGAKQIDCTRHVLIPGLINMHTHAAMSLFRGLKDDVPLMTWLAEHIWPAEARWVSPEFVRAGTMLAIAEMLRGGITCFNDMYFFPDVVAECAVAAGMRACVGLIVIDFPSAWARDAQEYFAKGQAVHERWRGHSMIHTALAPHAPYTVSDPILERVRDLSVQWDLSVHMHIHETAHEVAQALANDGMRPLARLDRLGLLDPRLQAVHMTALEPAEIELIAERGVHVLHCPESNLKLASGFCPVERLRNAGINVAIGTDGAASNNDLDLIGELRTAALLAKGVAQDAAALPASAALAMATINAARALRWEQEIGSLEVGKAADVVAVRMDEIESQPCYDPLAQLIYATGRAQVTDVWVAGRRLLENRFLTTQVQADVAALAADWQRRLTTISVSA